MPCKRAVHALHSSCSLTAFLLVFLLKERRKSHTRVTHLSVCPPGVFCLSDSTPLQSQVHRRSHTHTHTMSPLVFTWGALIKPQEAGAPQGAGEMVCVLQSELRNVLVRETRSECGGAACFQLHKVFLQMFLCVRALSSVPFLVFICDSVFPLVLYLICTLFVFCFYLFCSHPRCQFVFFLSPGLLTFCQMESFTQPCSSMCANGCVRASGSH